MQTEGDEIHVETDEARGGSTPNIVRWVLAISLFAAIALLSVIWITGAASRHEIDKYVTVPDTETGRTSADDTDSIVGEDADEMDTAEPGDAGESGPPTVENQAADAEPAPEPSAS